MKIEISKTLQTEYEVTNKEILSMPKEYQEAYKNYMEIEELKKQKNELNKQLSEEINKLVLPLPKGEEVPKYSWSATEIGYLVDKNCSVIGKLATKMGYKEKACKTVTGITAAGFQYKYWYDYDTVIEIAKFYNVLTDIPSKEVLKTITSTFIEHFYYGRCLTEDNISFISLFVNTKLVRDLIPEL